jgi:hypothetical protein
MQKEHDDSQRRSAKTLRTVDTLNIASFERVKYKGAAKERIGSWKKQHSEQNEALNAAVNKARERVEDDNPVMFTLPGSQIPEGSRCWCWRIWCCRMCLFLRSTGGWTDRCAWR